MTEKRDIVRANIRAKLWEKDIHYHEIRVDRGSGRVRLAGDDEWVNLPFIYKGRFRKMST